MLAAAPPLPPLICTIRSVQTRWTPREIAGVRILEGQTFQFQRHPGGTVSPWSVIESRISSLAGGQKSRMYREGDDWLYQWSYRAPLGPVAPPTSPDEPPRSATIHVEGMLRVKDDLSFRFVNRSRMRADGTAQPLTQLREAATGDCDEQR